MEAKGMKRSEMEEDYRRPILGNEIRTVTKQGYRREGRSSRERRKIGAGGKMIGELEAFAIYKSLLWLGSSMDEIITIECSTHDKPRQAKTYFSRIVGSQASRSNDYGALFSTGVGSLYHLKRRAPLGHCSAFKVDLSFSSETCDKIFSRALSPSNLM